jgi:F-type H+-transporting ATPase subunit b
VKRRILLGVMLLVTAWSLWAWAQPGGPRPLPPGRMPPGMSMPPGHPMPPGMGGAMPPGRMPPGMPPGAAFGRPTMAPTPPPPPVRPEPTQELSPAEKAAEEEKEANAPPADVNWVDFGRSTPPYIAAVINFALLFGGYYWIGKKPIAAALKGRRASIAREIEEATKMRKEAEKRAKHYQAKLERLETEVQTTKDALVRAGEAERERLVQDAEAKAERMRKDAEFLVEQELKQLRVDLQRDTVEAAIAAAEELLKKRVTPADQERLAEDYLADLARQPARPDAQRSRRDPSPAGPS